MQRIFLSRAAVAIDVGIGEIDSQRRIVVAHVGAEQQGCVLQHHLKPREVTRVGVEQPSGPPAEAPISPWLSSTMKVSSCERARRRAAWPVIGYRTVIRRRAGDASGDDLRNDVSCHLNLWRLSQLESALRTHGNASTRLTTRGIRPRWWRGGPFRAPRGRGRDPFLHQDIGRTVLDDPAALQHDHAVEAAQRREAVCDRHHRTPTHQPRQRLADRSRIPHRAPRWLRRAAGSARPSGRRARSR